MLTAEQIKTLEEMGFERRTVKVREGHTYDVWEIEFFPNEDAPPDAIIGVHVIDGKLKNVSSYIDKHTTDSVRTKYETTLAKLREGE